VLATYKDDFYAGRPALVVNGYGEGAAYTLSANADDRFLGDFYGTLAGKLALLRSLDAHLPQGVSAQLRTDGERDFIFLMNWNDTVRGIDLGERAYTDLLTGETLTGVVKLGMYDVKVLTE
jgi:beta-galactosidase